MTVQIVINSNGVHFLEINVKVLDSGNPIYMMVEVLGQNVSPQKPDLSIPTCLYISQYRFVPELRSIIALSQFGNSLEIPGIISVQNSNLW